MAYFIFTKSNCLYRIAENQIDFDNLNINDSDYIIVQDSQQKFDSLRLRTHECSRLENNSFNILPIDSIYYPNNSDKLKKYIENILINIEAFLSSNPNDIAFTKWKNYRDQLFSFDVNSVTFPMNKSLEQYFSDNNLPSLNILQLP
jgi:hypothetical protein